MKPDIIIPTYLSHDDIAPLMCEIQGYSLGCRVIATCQDASAAENRNYGLDEAESDIVIMLDDDITGFYDGWWKDLIQPLEDPDVVYVSARLMNTEGERAAMMFKGNPSEPHLTSVPRAPTACVAFRNTELRFNELFLGSGFEDDDFCAQIQHISRQAGKFVINNKCELIHLNEQKRQGAYYDENKKLFDTMWVTSGVQTETRTLAKGAQNIPKTIHFIWLGSEMPSFAVENYSRFVELNPSYRILTHLDDSEVFPEWRKAYNRLTGEPKEWSRKSDLLRLSILLKEGGWYFDTDFLPFRPVDDLYADFDLSHGFFVTEYESGKYANGVLGISIDSVAAEILRLQIPKVIELVDKYWNKTDSMDHWGAFGPSLITRVLKNIPGWFACSKPEMFFPVPWDRPGDAVRDWQEIVEGKQPLMYPNDPYMLHMHLQERTIEQVLEEE